MGEELEEAEPSKFEQWLNEKLGEKAVSALMAVAAVLGGLGIGRGAIARDMAACAMTESRHGQEEVGQVRLIKQMSKEKNALAGSRAFDYIAGRQGRKELLLMMNCLGDVHHWSENTCWIFDADFEFLAHESIEQIVCAGQRAAGGEDRVRARRVPRRGEAALHPRRRYLSAVRHRLAGAGLQGIRPSQDAGFAARR